MKVPHLLLVSTFLVIFSVQYGFAFVTSTLPATVLVIALKSDRSIAANVWIPKDIVVQEHDDGSIKSEYTDVSSAFVRPNTKIVKPSDFVSEKPVVPADTKVADVLKVFSKVYKKPTESKESSEESEYDYSDEEEEEEEEADQFEPESSEEHDEAPPTVEYSESGEESKENTDNKELLKLKDYPPSVREGVLKAVIREMGYDPAALIPANEKYDDSEEQKKEYNRPLLSSYKRKNSKNKRPQEEDDEGSDSDEGPDTEEIQDDLEQLPPEIREKYQAALLSQHHYNAEQDDEPTPYQDFGPPSQTHGPPSHGSGGHVEGAKGEDKEPQEFLFDIMYADKGGKKKKKGKGKKKGGGHGWKQFHYGPPPHSHGHGGGWHHKGHDGILEQMVRGSAWERILWYYHQKHDEIQQKGGWSLPSIHLETGGDEYGPKIKQQMKGTIWDKMINTYGDWRKKNMHGGTHELTGAFSINKGHQHHPHYSRH